MSSLVFGQTGINLSLFTKDLRGGELLNESKTNFRCLAYRGGPHLNERIILFSTVLSGATYNA